MECPKKGIPATSAGGKGGKGGGKGGGKPGGKAAPDAAWAATVPCRYKLTHGVCNGEAAGWCLFSHGCPTAIDHENETVNRLTDVLATLDSIHRDITNEQLGIRLNYSEISAPDAELQDKSMKIMKLEQVRVHFQSRLVTTTRSCHSMTSQTHMK